MSSLSWYFLAQQKLLSIEWKISCTNTSRKNVYYIDRFHTNKENVQIYITVKKCLQRCSLLLKSIIIFFRHKMFVEICIYITYQPLFKQTIIIARFNGVQHQLLNQICVWQIIIGSLIIKECYVTIFNLAKMTWRGYFLFTRKQLCKTSFSLPDLKAYGINSATEFVSEKLIVGCLIAKE